MVCSPQVDRQLTAYMMHPVYLSTCSVKSAKRWFAVKALSWCSPPNSPERTKNSEHVVEDEDVTLLRSQNEFLPVERLGIVAAMSSNRIIGVNGKLPWRLPKDRKAFKALTENTVLIIGRRTYEEIPLRRHINHAAASVVLSRTLDKDQVEDSSLRVARSFPEALHIARILAEELNVVDDGSNRIPCWVAGGERVYHEALVHPCAAELHLTIVSSEIRDLADQQSARFPAKYRWDNKFVEVSKEEDVDGGLKTTQYRYNRLPGRR